jgi:asparagine synthetase B (glutamine-hydrolysing)
MTNTGTAVQNWATLLRNAVKQWGSWGGSLSLGVSGLDSALLLTLAVEEGIAVRAFTVAASEDDGDLDVGRRIAGEHGVPHVAIVVPPGEQPRYFRAAVRGAGSLVFNGRGVLGVPLFRAMRAAGGTCALSGMGADETFGGHDLAQATLMLAILHGDQELAATLFAERPPPFALPAELPIGSLAAEVGLRLALPIEVAVAEAEGVTLGLPYLDDAVVAAADRQEDKRALRELARTRGGTLAALADRPKTRRYAAVGHPAWGDLYAELLTRGSVSALGLVPARVEALRDQWREPSVRQSQIDRVLMRVASLVVLAS